MHTKEELLEKCFECFCRNGIEGTSTQKLAKACGMSSGNIFYYFGTKDEIIVRSTAYCMEKVEEDFMKNAPKNALDISRFLKEVPFWTAKKRGRTKALRPRRGNESSFKMRGIGGNYSFSVCFSARRLR